VVGSGPNGLVAAITLARAGKRVLVREAEDAFGGGTRSAELTLPGFIHDVCSSVHPFVAGSPALRRLGLAEHGLELVQPSAPLAHPLDDGTAVILERSVAETAAGLGADAEAYRLLLEHLIADWEEVESFVLGRLAALPAHPLALARFGRHAVRSATGLASQAFREERARALFAGCAAHSLVPLERSPTAGFGLVLLLSGHLFGWPFPRGGSQQLANALVSLFEELGGEAEAGAPVDSLDSLPRTRSVFCDVSPRELVRIAGERLPRDYVRRLGRFRHGPGAFKVDYALDGPIPWTAAECARAGTVHLGGTLPEIAESERAPWRGEHAERPFVLLAQQSLFDPTRAPAERQTAWAYCHVPNGSDFDMTARIEAQIERFAPGFGARVLGRSVLPPRELERRNRNLVGGDLNGGAANLWRLAARPVAKLNPYATPARGVYLCSASTPPGGGVHGMCGHLAAQAALGKGL
jgi:phytoene dehydrogenase-like protein